MKAELEHRPDGADKMVRNVFSVGNVEVVGLSFPGASPRGALVFFHGGGFLEDLGDRDLGLCSSLVLQTGLPAYLVCYRHCPDHTYPLATMDGLSVWKHLLWKGKVSPEESVFVGEGTGGTLALSVALWARDHGIPLPSCIVLDHPWTGRIGGVAEGISTGLVADFGIGDVFSGYFSSADADDPAAFPILADYFLFPPVAVAFGEDDSEGQGGSLLLKLKDEGVPSSRIRSLAEGMEDASAFIRSCLGAKAI